MNGSVSESSYSIVQLTRSLELSRSTYYKKLILEEKDKQVSVAIETIHQSQDDTLGHKKLAALLGTSKNRVLRIMKKYGITARRRGKRYQYPGKSDVIFNNLANNTLVQISEVPIVFSDIFEFKLGDGSRVRGCFALLKKSRQILSLVFDYSMRAALVVTTIKRIDGINPNSIWHSDQGKQFGAEVTIDTLLERGFTASMSRAGTPTDNPFAERFVGVFKHAVVRRRSYQTLGEFLTHATAWINFYNETRPHEGLGQISPNNFARKNKIPVVPYFSNLSVY